MRKILWHIKKALTGLIARRTAKVIRKLEDVSQMAPAPLTLTHTRTTPGVSGVGCCHFWELIKKERNNSKPATSKPDRTLTALRRGDLVWVIGETIKSEMGAIGRKFSINFIYEGRVLDNKLPEFPRTDKNGFEVETTGYIKVYVPDAGITIYDCDYKNGDHAGVRVVSNQSAVKKNTVMVDDVYWVISSDEKLYTLLYTWIIGEEKDGHFNFDCDSYTMLRLGLEKVLRLNGDQQVV